MAEVLLTLKIMPASADSDLEAISEGLKSISSGRFNNVEKEPIGFGIVALKAGFVVTEEEGASERLEEEVKKIEGVGEVEIIESHRLI
ncbi:elongation factor 1-beta [archaeon]|nr:elongation factor 1-beta [archaeon]